MQAQVKGPMKTIDSYIESPDGNVTAQSIQWYPSRPYLQIFMDSEHIIEIRTKRVRNGMTRECSFISYGTGGDNCETVASPTYCPEVFQCEDLYDYHKTLWIDGQRIGVIRETEE